MTAPIRVLVIEDTPTDAELTIEELRRAGYVPDWRCVDTEPEFLTALQSHWDIIFSDYHLPQFSSQQVLALAQAHAMDTPVIVITGAVGEEIAVECIKQGAADYLLKDRLARLGPAVQRALEEKRVAVEKRRTEETLRQQNEWLTALHETALSVLNRLELMPLLESIVARVGDLLHTTHGYVDLVLPDGSAIEQVVGRGIFSEMAGEQNGLGEGVGGRIWQTGQPLVIDDYATWPGRNPRFATAAFHAIGGVPLKSSERIVGVLGLGYAEPGRKFDSRHIEIITRFADLAALAIDNARLHASAQAEIAERKRAEAAIQRERDFAVQITSTLGQGVTVTRADGVFDFVNPAYARMIGYEPAELIGKRTADVTVEDDISLLDYQRSRRWIGETSSYEVRLQHKDGHQVPVLITGTPRYEEGRLIGAITVVTDLTERKQNEAVRNAIYLIAQATTHTQSLTDLFPAVHEIIKTIMPARNFYIALYDEKNDLLNFPYYADEYDAPAPPVKPGTGFTEYVLRTGKSLLADQKTAAQIEASGDAAMVGTRPVIWLGVPLSVEQKTMGVMVVQDYSAPCYGEREQSLLEFVSSEIAGAINRKRAEESLRASEGRFRTLAENIPGVIFQRRNDDRYTFVYLNDAIEDLTGYAKEDFLESGLSFFDLYHPDDLEWMPRPSQQPGVNATPYQITYRIRHKSGAWRWVEEWGTAIRDADDRPALLEGFMADVTERKWAEDMLGRTARELAALDHMGKAVAGTLDLDDVLRKVIDEVSPLVLAEGISILLPEGEHTLVFAAASGPAAAGLTGHRIPLMAGTAGRVMKTGVSALIASGSGESQLYREVESISQYHTQSLLAVPLALGGEVIGVMEAVHTQAEAFTLEDQRLMEAAATWAAIAIGNARQHERLQRRLQEGEAMSAISRALNQTLDLPIILQLIADSARKVIPAADRSVIQLFDETQQALRPVAASGGRLSADDLTLRSGEGIAGKVFAYGKLINSGNTAQDPNYVPMRGRPEAMSLLSVPVESGQRRLGTLNLDSRKLNAFTKDDERLLTNLGVQAALAIENARLFESASRRANELNAASDMLRLLNAAASIADVFPAIASGLASICGAERISLGLYDDLHEYFTIVALDRPRPEIPIGTRLRFSNSSSATQDLLNGRVHITPNLSAEQEGQGELDLLAAGYKSRMNIPLRVGGGRVIGAINLNWIMIQGYNPAQIPLLEQIADAVALALEKNRLLVETTEALAREQRLAEVARTISSSTDLAGALDSITRIAAQLVDADAASLALIQPNSQFVSSVHLYNFPNSFANIPIPRGQGVAWKIIDSRKPMLLPDYAAHPSALPEWVQAGARAFLGVPLIAGPDCLGVLGLFHFGSEKSFSSREVAVAEGVGRQAGVAIQNAQLFQALNQEKSRIELLFNVSRNLATTLDPYEVATRAIEATSKTMGAVLCSVNLLVPGTDRLIAFAMTGFEGEALADVSRRADMRIGKGFNGHVAFTRKPLFAPDLSRDPHWISISGPDDDARSAIGIPLLVGDELIGAFTLLSKELNYFKAEHLPLLTAVASSLALALRNARSFESERERVEALTALHEISLELSAQLELVPLLNSIVERARRLLGAPMGGLSLIQPVGETLEVIVSQNFSVDYAGQRLPISQGAAGLTARTGIPQIVDDYHTWPLRAEVYKDASFASVVAVPVKWRGQVLGVITVNDPRPYAFMPGDIELVSLFADQAAVAIANTRQRDELQRRLKESNAVSAISRALNETLDLQKVLALIVEHARQVIPNVDRAVIHLLDRDQQTLLPAAVNGSGEAGHSVIMRPGEGVAGQVIAKGAVINVGDTHNDPRYLIPDRASPTRSLLVAPVQSGTHLLGTLSVNSTRINAFSTDDERLMGTLGAQAALAIYNAQLFEDTRRQLDELLLLHTVAVASAEATSENELIDRITRLIDNTFYQVGFGVMLLDDSGQFLSVYPASQSGPPDYRISLGQGITGQVALSGQPWLVPDVRAEPAYITIDADTRSELCVPLKAGNTILGVLDAASNEVDGFTEKDERLLTTLAGQLATAIQKLRYFRDLEQALRQEKAARMQLVQSEKLAAMGRLVASVAHELNNPLQAIQNALYLVKQEPALSEQAFDDLKVAATEAERMAELISRLRDTYRPASGEEFRFESINGVVAEVQKLIGTHLRHNHIEFKFDPDPNLPPVPGIRDQLKQVLLNLCLNGVEAMPSGGRLTVRTRHEPAQSSILLTIQDTGLGIKPEALHNIFDPFFTTKETGTGLGLTITYDIIQRHKGRIEVASQPGHGTTFSIWLPIEIMSAQP